MKKEKFFYLFILFFSLFSCTKFNSIDYDFVRISNKTSIKDISEVKDPIVITMGINSNKSNHIKTSEIKGDIFVVIDWENEKVFDWVFSPDKEGSVTWRCVELGKNPVKYFASGYSGKLRYIQKGNNQVQSFDVNYSTGYLDNLSSNGNYGLLTDFTFDTEKQQDKYRVYVVDMINQKRNPVPIDVLTFSNGYICPPVSDSEGNFYFGYHKIENNTVNVHIAKIECKKNILVDFSELIYPLISEDEIDISTGEPKYFYSKVLNVSNNVIAYTRSTLGSGDRSGLIYGYDITNNKKSKPIPFPENIDSKEPYLYAFASVPYKNQLIVTVCGGLETYPGKKMVYICEYDIEKGSSRLLTSVDFDMTETIWLRDNRLYMMNSRNTLDIKYMYINLDDYSASEPVRVTLDDVIKQ